jgi:hypothetical protein
MTKLTDGAGGSGSTGVGEALGALLATGGGALLETTGGAGGIGRGCARAGDGGDGSAARSAPQAVRAIASRLSARMAQDAPNRCR